MTNVRATHVQVEERVDGTMRMTHHGQTASTFMRITARPVKAAAVKPRHPRRYGSPVTPRPDASVASHACGSERHKPRGGGRNDVNRTFLLGEEEDISIWA